MNCGGGGGGGGILVRSQMDQTNSLSAVKYYFWHFSQIENLDSCCLKCRNGKFCTFNVFKLVLIW